MPSAPDTDTDAAITRDASHLKFIRLNAVWLSDIHLGYKGCRADFLLDFLDSIDFDTLYLVGDVVDFWSMKKRFQWPQKHQEVLERLLDFARQGRRVIYIPGNHDAWCRSIVDHELLDVLIAREYIHTTALGKRLLLVHGDEFDYAVRCSRLNKWLGNASYEFLLFLNRWGNRFRKLFKRPYWSLAYYVKNRVANARAAITAFENAAIAECKQRKVDGIICGHIHQPELRLIDDKLYCNDGDWIESCTALVEHRNGELELIHWGDLQQALKTQAVADSDSHAPLRLPNLAR